MAGKQYRFNHETLTYEKIRQPIRLRLYRIVRKLLVAYIIVGVINFVYSSFTVTPKMRRIEREHEELQLKYRILNDRIDYAGQKLALLKERDDHVYRSLFEVKPLEVAGTETPFPEERYTWLEGDPYSWPLRVAWQKLDGVTRALYRQSLSLDQLQKLVFSKELMATSIPASWPINMRRLRSLSHYGNRFHPIRKRIRFHQGIDLGGRLGDPVYATGNGVVKSTSLGLRHSGYGRQILINHGFGYQTRYAHLTSILVTEGQRIRRGEQIGTVGSTGGSTGPHLHYEVIYRGSTVNPINYLKRDMDESEFKRIIEEAKTAEFETDTQETR